MARRRKNNGFSQPMISFEYFFDNEQVLKIRTVQRRASAPTSLRHNECITLLFIKQGYGEIAVNTHRLPVERGTLMALSDYQHYQIFPAGHTSMDYVECQFEYLLYLFFMSSPYCQFSVPGFGSIPVVASVSGELLSTTERLMDLLVKSHQRERSGQREVLQVMELMGVLIKASNAEEDYPNPPPESPHRRIPPLE